MTGASPTFRMRRRAPGGSVRLRDDLFGENRDKPCEIDRVPVHQNASSNRRSLSSRLRYRASVIDAERHAFTISMAVGGSTIVAPSVSTLAPLCSRAYRASVTDGHIAARTPRILLAAMADPRPAPSITIPASASPRTTARLTRAATSG